MFHDVSTLDILGLSLPQDVIVTNAELQGRNVISTSFHVSVDGMVNKTQRLLVKIKAGEEWEWTP